MSVRRMKHALLQAAVSLVEEVVPRCHTASERALAYKVELWHTIGESGRPEIQEALDALQEISEELENQKLRTELVVEVLLNYRDTL